MTLMASAILGFLSTPSARRATIRQNVGAQLRQISIHALREEGDGPRPPPCRWRGISIHALREEGDCRGLEDHPGVKHISIHALREEGDRNRQALHRAQYLFLSTPSARRATDGHR